MGLGQAAPKFGFGWCIGVACLLLLCTPSSGAFQRAWHPETSDHFQASSSSSFTAEPEHVFALHYADSTELRCFECADNVQLGNLAGYSHFACIYHCNSPDFNGVDGILGFGRPHSNSKLPTPLFFSLTDPGNSQSNGAQMARRFSFLSTAGEAELQLGGYDPAAVGGGMMFVNTVAPDEFTVRVSSIKFGTKSAGTVELLQFTTPSVRDLPGIVDSGTSCLVMPGSTIGGLLKQSPFGLFHQQELPNDASFWITIEGHTLEIPYDAWFLKETNEACVESAPAGMHGLLLGDVIFRQYLVQFDMTRNDVTTIGFAPLKPGYKPVSQIETHSVDLEQPVHRLSVLGKLNPRLAMHRTNVDDMPVFNRHGTQYFVNVTVGTPKQSFTVIFDTGSSVFGLFVRESDLPSGVRSRLPNVMIQTDAESVLRTMSWGQMGVFLVVLNASALVLATWVYKRRRHPPMHMLQRRSGDKGGAVPEVL